MTIKIQSFIIFLTFNCNEIYNNDLLQECKNILLYLSEDNASISAFDVFYVKDLFFCKWVKIG